MAKKKKKNKDRSPNIIAEIQGIHFMYERAFDKLYASLDISNEQFKVLEILSEEEDGLALNEIQSLLPNQTSNTTRLVNKLQAKKFLSKKADPEDNRKLIISITEMGQNVLTSANDLSKPINKSLKKATSTVSAKTLLGELKELRKALESSSDL